MLDGFTLVICGKGGSSRELPVPAGAGRRLDAYLTQRQMIADSEATEQAIARGLPCEASGVTASSRSPLGIESVATARVGRGVRSQAPGLRASRNARHGSASS